MTAEELQAIRRRFADAFCSPPTNKTVEMLVVDIDAMLREIEQLQREVKRLKRHQVPKTLKGKHDR